MDAAVELELRRIADGLAKVGEITTTLEQLVQLNLTTAMRLKSVETVVLELAGLHDLPLEQIAYHIDQRAKSFTNEYLEGVESWNPALAAKLSEATGSAPGNLESIFTPKP